MSLSTSMGGACCRSVMMVPLGRAVDWCGLCWWVGWLACSSANSVHRWLLLDVWDRPREPGLPGEEQPTLGKPEVAKTGLLPQRSEGAEISVVHLAAAADDSPHLH